MNIESNTKELEDKGRFFQDVNFESAAVEINQVKNQNLFLKQLIAQLSHENQLLKKRLFSAGKTEITKDKCA
jgi:hypothetical protein